MKSWLEKKDNQTLLKLYIQPGAHKNEIIGDFGDPARLKIKINAIASDGAANKELINFLSKKLKISKSNIILLRGTTSRKKDLLLNAAMEEIEKQFILIL